MSNTVIVLLVGIAFTLITYLMMFFKLDSTFKFPHFMPYSLRINGVRELYGQMATKKRRIMMTIVLSIIMILFIIMSITVR